jgi:hypothetical protein
LLLQPIVVTFHISIPAFPAWSITRWRDADSSGDILDETWRFSTCLGVGAALSFDGYRVVRSFRVFRASRGPNLGLNAMAQEMKRGKQVEYCDDGIGANLAISDFCGKYRKMFRP